MAKCSLFFLIFLQACYVFKVTQETTSLKTPSIQEQAEQCAKNQKPDFSSIPNVKTKKEQFFEYLYPRIVLVNQTIHEDRSKLLSFVQSQRQTPSPDVASLIQNRCGEYLKACEGLSYVDSAKSLLKNLDIVPPSLAMAQAAYESSWGTSRFAKHGNNFFGQRCFSVGCGLVPKYRISGPYHEVEAFESPFASIASYIRNINKSGAYSALRKIRVDLRKKGKFLLGLELADGLSLYSERGKEYVFEVKKMIQVNNLTNYDYKFYRQI
jgi:Bax protein